MSQSQSTTYTCDLCGAKGHIGGKNLPQGWEHIRPYDLCPKCIKAIVNSLTLEEAKQLVKEKTPIIYAPCPPSCRCQRCNPHAN